MKIQVAAKALLIDSKGAMLILRRSGTHPTKPFWPDLPGGLVDEGENFEQAVLREIKEECDLDVLPEQCKLAVANTWFERDHEDDVSITRLLYIIRLNDTKPAITLSWEHDQYEWVPGDKLHDNFESSFKELVAYVYDYGLLQYI